MKSSKVSIPWKQGLHLRSAADIVENANSFESSIELKVNKKTANARSIFSILLLTATMGTVIEVKASGTDEEQAVASIVRLFDTDVAEYHEEFVSKSDSETRK